MAKKNTKIKKRKRIRPRLVGNSNLKPFAKGNDISKLDLNWDRIKNLAQVGCTQVEIAHVMECHPDTLNNRCKQEFGHTFKEFLDKNQGIFKASLRRAQLKSALGEKKTVTVRTEEGETIEVREMEEYVLKPSVQMQQWLGKQFLGQSEKVDVGIGGIFEDAEVVIDDSHAPRK